MSPWPQQATLRCGLKAKSFGLPGEKPFKRKWCGGCAKNHLGAAPLPGKMCEGCGGKRKNFGLPGQRVRWCGDCAKSHPGAIHWRKRQRKG